MKNVFHNSLRAAAVLVAALFAMLPSEGALAQTVTQLPLFVAPHAILDLGNSGALEIMPLTGNGGVFTSQGSGLGATATSVTVTLAASAAANPPCIGCGISGGGIPAGDTVTAFNGTTVITMSAAATSTVGSELISFGTACPVSTMAAPIVPPASALMVMLQAGVSDALQGIPFYTLARLCAFGGNGPGMQFAAFPIGAH